MKKSIISSCQLAAFRSFAESPLMSESGTQSSSTESKSWLFSVVMVALMLSAFTFLSFIGTSRRKRMRQLIMDTLGSIGVFCLWLIRLMPKGLLLRIPAWLGIPMVINALLALVAVVAGLAAPFFQEVFGKGQDKTKK